MDVITYVSLTLMAAGFVEAMVAKLPANAWLSLRELS